MTKRNKVAIARLVMLVFTIFIISLTLQTISVGLTLASISEENSRTETWRISGMGKAAADSVYLKNAEYRNQIYNSNSPYIRWISTANTLVQLIVGFSLIALSGLLLLLWTAIIQADIKRFKKRRALRNKLRKTYKNSQTV